MELGAILVSLELNEQLGLYLILINTQMHGGEYAPLQPPESRFNLRHLRCLTGGIPFNSGEEGRKGMKRGQRAGARGASWPCRHGDPSAGARSTRPLTDGQVAG
jgi:hypothetical protein